MSSQKKLKTAKQRLFIKCSQRFYNGRLKINHLVNLCDIFSGTGKLHSTVMPYYPFLQPSLYLLGDQRDGPWQEVGHLECWLHCVWDGNRKTTAGTHGQDGCLVLHWGSERVNALPAGWVLCQRQTLCSSLPYKVRCLVYLPWILQITNSIASMYEHEKWWIKELKTLKAPSFILK